MGRGFSRRVPGGWTMIESTTLRTLKGQGVWTGLPGGQGWGPSTGEAGPYQGSHLELGPHLPRLQPGPSSALSLIPHLYIALRVSQLDNLKGLILELYHPHYTDGKAEVQRG